MASRLPASCLGQPLGVQLMSSDSLKRSIVHSFMHLFMHLSMHLSMHLFVCYCIHLSSHAHSPPLSGADPLEATLTLAVASMVRSWELLALPCIGPPASFGATCTFKTHRCEHPGNAAAHIQARAHVCSSDMGLAKSLQSGSCAAQAWPDICCSISCSSLHPLFAWSTHATASLCLHGLHTPLHPLVSKVHARHCIPLFAWSTHATASLCLHGSRTPLHPFVCMANTRHCILCLHGSHTPLHPFYAVFMRGTTAARPKKGRHCTGAATLKGACGNARTPT